MDWQWLVVTGAILASAFYVGRAVWRALAGQKSGCAGGCACPGKNANVSPTPLLPLQQLEWRERS